MLSPRARRTKRKRHLESKYKESDSKTKRYPYPQDLSLKLMIRDGPNCGICGTKLTGEQSIDHIIPISKGGTEAFDNLQLAHPKCNFSKSDGI